jgi:hypothetical protein
MAADPVTALAPMPGCNMKIFSGDPTYKEVAENVKIGDPLTLVITIDEQDTYGIRITDCLVRDGLGWGEQKLINDEGCPLDAEIMGRFEYSEDKTKASVHFQAHKFPYTASVYYQCNVKLCLKADGGCDISDDGGIEYFNTIVVQPHLKLVTNQGRGFHIRCRYNTRNNTVTNDSLKVE